MEIGSKIGMSIRVLFSMIKVPLSGGVASGLLVLINIAYWKPLIVLSR